MIIIKSIVLLLIFILSSILGLVMSNRYKQRVNDLKNMRNVLNILETKIKYTYEPLPQIFKELSKDFDGEVGKIFELAAENMNEMSARRSLALFIEKFKYKYE